MHKECELQNWLTHSAKNQPAVAGKITDLQSIIQQSLTTPTMSTLPLSLMYGNNSQTVKYLLLNQRWNQNI